MSSRNPVEQEGHRAPRLRAPLPRMQQCAIEQGGRGLRILSHAAGYADQTVLAIGSRMTLRERRSNTFGGDGPAGRKRRCIRPRRDRFERSMRQRARRLRA